MWIIQSGVLRMMPAHFVSYWFCDAFFGCHGGTVLDKLTTRFGAGFSLGMQQLVLVLYLHPRLMFFFPMRLLQVVWAACHIVTPASISEHYFFFVVVPSDANTVLTTGPALQRLLRSRSVIWKFLIRLGGFYCAVVRYACVVINFFHCCVFLCKHRNYLSTCC